MRPMKGQKENNSGMSSVLIRYNIAKDRQTAEKLLVSFSIGAIIVTAILTAYTTFGNSIARAHSSLPPDVIRDLEAYAKDQNNEFKK